jgi:hypothetical protein
VNATSFAELARRGPDERAFEAGCGYSGPFPSDLRIFDVSRQPVQFDYGCRSEVINQG